MLPRLFSIIACFVFSIPFQNVLAQQGLLENGFGADGKGVGGPVYSIAVQTDGKLVVGGSFGELNDANGSQSRACFGRFNADGTVDAGFGSAGKGTNGAVNAVVALPDGKILIGGTFNTVSDASGTYGRSNIARLNTDGSVDQTFGTDNKGPNLAVNAIVAQSDGKILIGGNFINVTDANGTHDRRHIARLNSNGSVDTTFGADGKGADNNVFCVAVQPDGKIVITGSFTMVSDAGSTLDRLGFARLGSDGSVDAGFGANSKGANFLVEALALQTDGKILIGGGFTSITDVVGSRSRSGVARLNADGSVDTSFGAEGSGTSGNVYTMTLQADGSILIGGPFTSYSDGTNTLDRAHFARLLADGTIDENFGADGATTDGSISAIAIQEDGKVNVGGDFSVIDDGTTSINRNGVARYGNGEAGSQVVASAGAVQWLRDGSAPEAAEASLEVSIDGGSTWNPLGTASRITGGWEFAGASTPADATLRLRAFISGEGNGSYFVEELLSVSRPVLTITGPRKIKTTRPTALIRGTSTDPDGDLSSVQFLDSRKKGKRFRAATGLSPWSARALLKPGRNLVLVKAIDRRGIESNPQRVTVVKK